MACRYVYMNIRGPVFAPYSHARLVGYKGHNILHTVYNPDCLTKNDQALLLLNFVFGINPRSIVEKNPREMDEEHKTSVLKILPK